VEIKIVTKKKKNDTFFAIWHRCKMAVTWLYATVLISVCSFCRGRHTGVSI